MNLFRNPNLGNVPWKCKDIPQRGSVSGAGRDDIRRAFFLNA